MQCATETDLTLHLPPEILHEIFRYLDISDLGSVAFVCRRWNVILKSEIIWQRQCRLLCDSENVIADRQQGYSWKETFRLNYGMNAVKRKWRQGHFSQPKSYDDLPHTVMCKMEAEEWGQILQCEMER